VIHLDASPAPDDSARNRNGIPSRSTEGYGVARRTLCDPRADQAMTSDRLASNRSFRLAVGTQVRCARHRCRRPDASRLPHPGTDRPRRETTTGGVRIFTLRRGQSSVVRLPGLDDRRMTQGLDELMSQGTRRITSFIEPVGGRRVNGWKTQG